MFILVVEDDPLIGLGLEATLLGAAHTVCGPVMTARGAVALVERGKDLPDLALLDINLADGSGAGIDLARQLKRHWHIPSLFLSGQPIEAHANRDAALGYLGKPYTPEAILASIALIAQRDRNGSFEPGRIPPGLELF